MSVDIGAWWNNKDDFNKAYEHKKEQAKSAYQHAKEKWNETFHGKKQAAVTHMESMPETEPMPEPVSAPEPSMGMMRHHGGGESNGGY